MPSSIPAALNSAFDTWLRRERGRFALFLPAFMGAGIIAYFADAREPPVWLAVLPVVVAGLATLVLWRRQMPRGLALALLFAAGGFFCAALSTWRAPPWSVLPRQAAVVSGTVLQIDPLPEGRRVAIEAPSLDGGPALPRQLRLRLRDSDTTPLSPGDAISVRALVQVPAAPSYPGGWDTQRDAYFSGLAGYGFAIGPAERRAGGSPLVAPIRHAIASRILAALPGETGAIAATLLTGTGTAISAQDRANFANSGLAHLLAVAGLHIGIVMGLVFAATRLGLAVCEYTALRWPTKSVAALAALGAGGGYLVLTGGHLPILRSFAMACLVTLAILTGRRAISMRTLAVAAVGLMLASPVAVLGVSFQMSFSAVLALIAGYEALRPWRARIGEPRWWHGPAIYAVGLAATSGLAGTASMPFAAYHFGSASLYYVPANMLAVPLTGLWVLPWGLAALALMPLGLEHLALAPMGWGISGLIRIAGAVSAWPDAALAVPPIPAWGLAMVALGLIWLGIWRSRLRLVGLIPLAVGLLAAGLAKPPDLLVGPEARVIAVRVGGQVFSEISRRASKFDREATGRVWGISGASMLPISGEAADEAIDCSPVGCRIGVAGGTILLVRQPPGLSCEGVGAVVSAGTGGPGCAPAPMLDRIAAERDGTAFVWLDHGAARLLTDRGLRGDRPWVIQATVLLPPALTE